MAAFEITYKINGQRVAMHAATDLEAKEILRRALADPGCSGITVTEANPQSPESRAAKCTGS
jgi:hypothetical protein